MADGDGQALGHDRGVVEFEEIPGRRAERFFHKRVPSAGERATHGFEPGAFERRDDARIHVRIRSLEKASEVGVAAIRGNAVPFAKEIAPGGVGFDHGDETGAFGRFKRVSAENALSAVSRSDQGETHSVA